MWHTLIIAPPRTLTVLIRPYPPLRVAEQLVWDHFDVRPVSKKLAHVARKLAIFLLVTAVQTTGRFTITPFDVLPARTRLTDKGRLLRRTKRDLHCFSRLSKIRFRRLSGHASLDTSTELGERHACSCPALATGVARRGFSIDPPAP